MSVYYASFCKINLLLNKCHQINLYLIFVVNLLLLLLLLQLLLSV